MSLRITRDTTDLLADIREAVDDSDALNALGRVDRLLQDAGLPHVDPLDAMDEDDCRVVLIWLRLVARDWFPEDVVTFREILRAEPEEFEDLRDQV